MSSGPLRPKRRKLSENPYASEPKRSLYHCNYCSRNISDGVRIKCAVCQDFDLCIECFSVGVELGAHKANHAYRVMDYLAFPLFHPQWGADEEILLLEAVGMFGIGNWSAVAEHVSCKSAEECKSHYFESYVDTPDFPRPRAIGGLQDLPLSERRSLPVKPKEEELRRVRPRIDSGPGGPSGPDACPTVPGASASGEAPTSTPVPLEATPAAIKLEEKPSHELLGCSGTAAAGSTPEAKPLLSPGPALGRAVRERGKSGRLAAASWGGPVTGLDGSASAGAGGKTGRARGVGGEDQGGGPKEGPVGSERGKGQARADAKRAGSAAPGSTAQAPAGRARAQQQTKPDPSGYSACRDEFDPPYDNGAEGGVADLEFGAVDSADVRARKERMLEILEVRLRERERRRELLKRLGLTDLRRFEATERRRPPYERRLFANLRVFERFQSSEKHEALCSGIVLEHSLRVRIAELQEQRRLGARTLANGEEYLEAKRQSDGRERAQRDSQSAEVSVVPALPNVPNHMSPSDAPERTPVQILPPVWQGRRRANLNLEHLPGTDWLTPPEQTLCEQQRLLPCHYLLLKETLLREAERQKPAALTKQHIRSAFRLEPSRAAKLYDLAVTQGWISTTRPDASTSMSGAQS